MKKLSTLIFSFVLLGTLVSCGSGNSTSSGVSSNAGSVDTPTTGVNNSCVTNLKGYINNNVNALQYYYGAKSVYLEVTVAHGTKRYYGIEYTNKDYPTPQVMAGANKDHLLNDIANKASSCTQNGNVFVVKVGATEYSIAGYIPLEANPVQVITYTSDTEFDIKVVTKWRPDSVNYYSAGDIWDKIKDIF